MIKQEQALEFLKSKEGKALRASHFNVFSKKYNFLALLITKLSEEYKKGYYATLDLKSYEKYFGTDLSFNPWKEKEGKKLALFIFGENKAPYISVIWDLLLKSPYQDNHFRRSFRCKATSKYTVKRLTHLQNLYSTTSFGYANLNTSDTIRYDVYGEMYYKDFSYLFASYLNDENQSEVVYELMNDIIQGEDDIGGVTKSIIRGLLLTDEPKNWKLVEDLLLAAQRQEGLRQIILESLDETSLGALHHFIKVILDNNLERFSSVIRAVDTWFGFAWEAPKQQTIKKILSYSLSYFENADLVEKSLESKDNLEVYTALWFLALTDVDFANVQAIELIKKESKEKKILACMFISQTERTNTDVLSWIKDNFNSDLEIDFWLLHILPDQKEITDALFNQIKAYGDTLPIKGKSFEGKVFSWSSYTIKPDFFYKLLVSHANEAQQQILAKDISKIPSEERSDFIKKIFPNHYSWSYYYKKDVKVPKITLDDNHWKKDLIHQTIKDRNTSVMATGIQLYNSMDLVDSDFRNLESLLTRKSKDLRESIITLILGQTESVIKKSTANLVVSAKVDQRLAGLEILGSLYDKDVMVSYVKEQVTIYSERSKLSKNEEVYLDKFKDTSKEYSFENGFGDIDYDNLSSIIQPEVKFSEKKGNVLSKILSKVNTKQGFLFKNLIDEDKTARAINSLINLYEKNNDFEYQIINRDGTKEFVLLSNDIRFVDVKAHEIIDSKEKIKYLPLFEVWKTWYESSGLNDFELLTACVYCNDYPHQFEKNEHFDGFLKQYIPHLKGLKLVSSFMWDSINKKVLFILQSLYKAYADIPTVTQFKVDVLEDMLAKFPKDLKKKVEIEEWSGKKIYWCDNFENIGFFTSNINEDLRMFSPDVSLLKKYWNLKQYVMVSRINYPNTAIDISEIAKTNISTLKIESPNAWITAKLHKNNLINDDDFKYQLLINDTLLSVVDGGNVRWHSGIDKNDIPIGVFNVLKEHFLSIELDRGDLATEVTTYMNSLGTVFGSNYLFELLNRLGKETFHRGYYWGGVSSKKEIFSGLVKKSLPKVDEDLGTFLEQASTEKITKKKWIETAMYAPQWASWISEHLKIKKLEDAVWWFHAHASEYMSAEKETIVSRYSSIDKADFSKGVIDINWFQDVYPSVGKQNWKLLHDSVKYISTGNGHRLVKLYSAVMLGEVKIRETLAKIKDKRDKDYVKALGLVPLSKANKKKDLLTRYNLLQEFLKESKQFGAQRQESEKNAVEIGLDNLARNAGYDDSIRFSWAMEGEAIQNIMEKSVVQIDNVEVRLIVDEQGKADLKVKKDGKSQKSIPAKLKKDKNIVALQKSKAYIKKQYSRTRVSLENAMLREEEFNVEEIISISKHPVVYAMLVKLLLFNKTKNVFGFWEERKLKDNEGNITEIATEDVLLITHASHLYTNVVWDLYQKWAFENKLVQPFKQIFRELYILTPDEIERGEKSFRYEGHQIQPNKTVALLRSRGWTVNHEEGLQKVYHKKGFIASIYAMADWYSPADIEAPTLEFVSFYSRKDYKPIPLHKIDAVTYSEVMRDVDLVVSVAHVGGVDPEASHSTMQMRGVLARETARLFKADNVEVKERFILIKGQLGDYSIHLGSGVVSKNGLRLSIIPVHSQHRGRLFLPFLDDDPKSAEIISKMKLLSEDNKIKDPTILAQINKRTS